MLFCRRNRLRLPCTDRNSDTCAICILNLIEIVQTSTKSTLYRSLSFYLNTYWYMYFTYFTLVALKRAI